MLYHAVPEGQQTEVRFENTIDKEQVNELPLTKYEGTIHLIRSDEDVEAACTALRKEPILGFDTESRPSFRKGQSFPTALLQLGTESEVYLFQLLQLKNLQPIVDLLESPDILKVGVAIRDDIRKLEEDMGVRAAGFAEISEYTQRAGVINTGLRNLAAIFLGIRISKGSQVSNWARKRLTEAQIAYAATDAWVSRALYLRIVEMGLTRR